MLEAFYEKERIPLGETFGVPYPRYVINPIAEYNALVNFAGVLDLTHWRAFRLTGGDHISFLNAMLTNDVAALGNNQGCHTLITTVKGKIVAELFVYAREGDAIVLVSQGDADAAFDILSKHIIMEDVTIEDLSRSYGVIGVEGPKANDILWRMFPTGPFPKKPMEAVRRDFADAPVFMMRQSVSGEDGFHMLLPAAGVLRFRNYTVQAARGSDGLPVGSIALNMRRMENGRPWYGADFTDDNFPQEARLEGAVSYAKGCFRGQETLARLHYRGHVNRLLVGLVFDKEPLEEIYGTLDAEFEREMNNFDEIGLRKSAPVAAEALDIEPAFPRGMPLYDSDDDAKPVGRITSAAYSPQLKKSLVLAYVRHELARANKSVRVRTQEGTLTASIIDLPLNESE